MLTNAQLDALKAHIVANTDPVIVAAFAIRDDVTITNFYNGAGTTKAWKRKISKSDLFNNTPIAKFDTLTAGKRDAWGLVMTMDGVDATVIKFRKGVEDIWGTTDGSTLLDDACTETATIFEEVFGGPMQQTGTINALKRTVYGPVGLFELSTALNRP